jgi:hypothetical protein
MTSEAEWFRPGQVYALPSVEAGAFHWWARRRGYAVVQPGELEPGLLTEWACAAPLQAQEVLLLQHVAPPLCHPERRAVCLSPRLAGKRQALPVLPLLPAVWQELRRLGPLPSVSEEQRRQLCLKPAVTEAALRAGVPLSVLWADPLQQEAERLLSSLGTARGLQVWGQVPRARWYPLFYGPRERTVMYCVLRRSPLVYEFLRYFLEWGRGHHLYGEALSTFAAWVYVCAGRGEYGVTRARGGTYYNLSPGEASLRQLQQLLGGWFYGAVDFAECDEF